MRDTLAYLAVLISALAGVFLVVAFLEKVLIWLFGSAPESHPEDGYEEGEDDDCMPPAAPAKPNRYAGWFD